MRLPDVVHHLPRCRLWRASPAKKGQLLLVMVKMLTQMLTWMISGCLVGASLLQTSRCSRRSRQRKPEAEKQLAQPR